MLPEHLDDAPLIRAYSVVVCFLAPAGLDEDGLGAWPLVLARDAAGTLRSVPFGNRARGQQLASLLAHRPEGLRNKDVRSTLGTGAFKTDGVPNHAKGSLRSALEGVGCGHLLVLPEVGGRGAAPWRLQRPTTDVALAYEALERGDRALAAALTSNGQARLVGLEGIDPELDGWQAATLDPARRGSERGRLPRDLVEAGRDVAGRTRSPPAVVPSTPVAPASARGDARAPRRAGLGEPLGWEHWQPSVLCASAICATIMVIGVAANLAVVRTSKADAPRQPPGVGGRLEQQSLFAAATTFRALGISSTADGGNDGPTIDPGQRVLVECRTRGAATRGDEPSWWYRLAEPFAGLYVAASSFYNGTALPKPDEVGVLPQRVRRTRVDRAVAPCGEAAGTVMRTTTDTVPFRREARGGLQDGPGLPAGRRVVVACRTPMPAGHPPSYGLSQGPAYLYRLASGALEGYVAPALKFETDDGRPQRKPVDWSVPDC